MKDVGGKRQQHFFFSLSLFVWHEILAAVCGASLLCMKNRPGDQQGVLLLCYAQRVDVIGQYVTLLVDF